MRELDREQAEDELDRMENNIAAKRARISKLETENAALLERAASLEKQLAEADAVIFGGCHENSDTYLEAMVRHRARAARAAPAGVKS